MLTKNGYDIICEIEGCRKRATYGIRTKGRLAKIYICQDCLRRLCHDFCNAMNEESLREVAKALVMQGQDEINRYLGHHCKDANEKMHLILLIQEETEEKDKRRIWRKKYNQGKKKPPSRV